MVGSFLLPWAHALHLCPGQEEAVVKHTSAKTRCLPWPLDAQRHASPGIAAARQFQQVFCAVSEELVGKSHHLRAS